MVRALPPPHLRPPPYSGMLVCCDHLTHSYMTLPVNVSSCLQPLSCHHSQLVTEFSNLLKQKLKKSEDTLRGFPITSAGSRDPHILCFLVITGELPYLSQPFSWALGHIQHSLFKDSDSQISLLSPLPYPTSSISHSTLDHFH